MKIRISRQNLFDAVSKVKTIVSLKSALPILSHILIEAVENGVCLSATDLKVGIECSVDCFVDEAGSLTVPSHRLASILAELPDVDISLELAENSVVVLGCGKIETRLFSMSPEEFPPIRQFQHIEPLNFRQGVLKRLFSKTSFAICMDQARYNLTGLLFEISSGKLSVVATDGRRMSLCAETESIPEGLDIRVVIPGKMIGELERLLGDEEEVKVYIDETQAAFVFDRIRLVTALIEGNFPNYEMVIPKKHDKEAVANTAQLLEAVRRTRTMTNDKFNSVRFSLGSGSLTLKVVTPEVGEYCEEFGIQYEGDPVEIALNPDYVLDILRRIDSERVSLILKDSMSPGLIKPSGGESTENYLNVVMPIRI